MPHLCDTVALRKKGRGIMMIEERCWMPQICQHRRKKHKQIRVVVAHVWYWTSYSLVKQRGQEKMDRIDIWGVKSHVDRDRAEEPRRNKLKPQA